MPLVVYGDLNIDMVMRVAHLPQPDTDVGVDHLAWLPGGSAANTAAVASYLLQDTAQRSHVYFVGVTGNDNTAAYLLQDLQYFGVDTRHVRQVHGTPGVIIALTTTDGQRTLMSYRGVNALVNYGDPPADLFSAVEEGIFHLSGYSFETIASCQTALSLMACARQHNYRISIDPSYEFASDWSAHRDVIGPLTFIFPNQLEAQLMTGESDPLRAAHRLVQQDIHTVVIKCGAAGCYTLSPTWEGWVTALSAQLVDSVGAGDAFCGGYLAASYAGLPTELAIHIGCAAASHIVATHGGHSGAPTRLQVINSLTANGLWAAANALYELS